MSSRQGNDRLCVLYQPSRSSVNCFINLLLLVGYFMADENTCLSLHPSRRDITCRAKAKEKCTETAFPMSLYLSMVDPGKYQSSGKPWILLYSLIDNGRRASGCPKIVPFCIGEVT